MIHEWVTPLLHNLASAIKYAEECDDALAAVFYEMVMSEAERAVQYHSDHVRIKHEKGGG